MDYCIDCGLSYRWDGVWLILSSAEMMYDVSPFGKNVVIVVFGH